jgi:hypothetical protein
VSFYIYRLVELLILQNTSISLSAINYQSSSISHKLAYQASIVFTIQSHTLSVPLNDLFDNFTRYKKSVIVKENEYDFYLIAFKKSDSGND